MLTRERAAEFHDEVADIAHRGAESGDAGSSEEVEVDAAMHTAFAEVTVIGCRRKFVPRQQGHQAAQKIAEPGGWHRAILSAGPRARLSRQQRTGAESGFPNAPYGALLRRLLQDCDAGACGNSCSIALDRFRRGAQIVIGFRAQFSDQKSPA